MPPLRDRGLFDESDEMPERNAPDVSFDIALLSLGCVHGLGHKGLQALVAEYGESLGCVLTLPPDELKAKLSQLRINNAAKICQSISTSRDELLSLGEKNHRRLQSHDVTVLSPTQLPPRLTGLNSDAPKWLFVQGDSRLLYGGPNIAVVGTRRPTERAFRATSDVCYMLASYAVTIVSGLADGIDGVAHAVSLNRGLKNIAFLGHGIDIVFPEQTANVRAEILRQGGAIVSEYMPDQIYNRNQFIERNRLQAGLADVVIPIEAAVASGTAHTTRFARKYSRPLIGIRWDGSSGIVDELTAAGDVVIDIFSPSGKRKLDVFLQSLLQHHSGSHYPFTVLERVVAREFSNRHFDDNDVAKLLTTVQRLASEARIDG